jgi:hypothetical protein
MDKIEFTAWLERLIVHAVDAAAAQFYGSFREDSIGGIQRDWPLDISRHVAYTRWKESSPIHG